MKRLIGIIACVCISVIAGAQQIASLKAEQVIGRTNNKDTLYIINFWATWCAPCVRELPEFNKLEDHYKDRPVKILMVSLDFDEAYPKKIAHFVQKKKLKPEVAWLNETNPNEFIPKIENSWQGSIPATLIIYNKNAYRNFFEGAVTAEQIEMLADKQLAY